MRFRFCRTPHGYWGFGFGCVAGGHLFIQFGPWFITTEPVD